MKLLLWIVSTIFVAVVAGASEGFGRQQVGEFLRPQTQEPGVETPFSLSQERDHAAAVTEYSLPLAVRGGGWLIPAGYNPFGYKITELGEEFLSYDGSLDSDIGRFIASLKKQRVTAATLKAVWLEIVRASKSGQSMRIYRKIDELLTFCVKLGLID